MFYCGLLGSTCLIQSLGLRGGTGYIFVFVWILMNEPGIRICSLASKTRAFRFVSSPFLPARTIISARLCRIMWHFQAESLQSPRLPKKTYNKTFVPDFNLFPTVLFIYIVVTQSKNTLSGKKRSSWQGGSDRNNSQMITAPILCLTLAFRYS